MGILTTKPQLVSWSRISGWKPKFWVIQKPTAHVQVIEAELNLLSFQEKCSRQARRGGYIDGLGVFLYEILKSWVG